jgi:hypothetical protein
MFFQPNLPPLTSNAGFAYSWGIAGGSGNFGIAAHAQQGGAGMYLPSLVMSEKLRQMWEMNPINWQRPYPGNGTEYMIMYGGFRPHPGQETNPIFLPIFPPIIRPPVFPRPHPWRPDYEGGYRYGGFGPGHDQTFPPMFPPVFPRPHPWRPDYEGGYRYGGFGPGHDHTFPPIFPPVIRPPIFPGPTPWNPGWDQGIRYGGFGMTMCMFMSG